MVFVVASVASATSVQLYTSSGPWYQNSDGTDAAWFTQAKVDVAAGTFVDGRTGTYPGTTNVDPVDFLNAGNPNGPHLLYWFYYIPNTTAADLQNAGLFQTKLVIDWTGYEFALAPDHSGWLYNSDPSIGWGAPAAAALEEYNGGVFGQMRFSWNMSSMGASTVQEFRDAVFSIQTFARAEVRTRPDIDSAWEYSILQDNVVVPEPLTMAGVGLAVSSLVVYLRRSRRGDVVS